MKKNVLKWITKYFSLLTRWSRFNSVWMFSINIRVAPPSVTHWWRLWCCISERNIIKFSYQVLNAQLFQRTYLLRVTKPSQWRDLSMTSCPALFCPNMAQRNQTERLQHRGWGFDVRPPVRIVSQLNSSWIPQVTPVGRNGAQRLSPCLFLLWLLVWGWCGARLRSQVKAGRVHSDQQNALPRALAGSFCGLSLNPFLCTSSASCLCQLTLTAASALWLVTKKTCSACWRTGRSAGYRRVCNLRCSLLFLFSGVKHVCVELPCWSRPNSGWDGSDLGADFTPCLCCAIKSCQQTQDAQGQRLSVNDDALRFHQNPEQYEDGSDSDSCRNPQEQCWEMWLFIEEDNSL